MSVLPDEVDRKILAELQRDASQSLDEIARKVGSSKTPVWNRIRKLRDAGIIGQQTVVLNAEALGFDACFLCSFGQVSMKRVGKRRFCRR